MHRDLLRSLESDARSRREFLSLGGALTAALALRGLPAIRSDRRPRFVSDPFTLGVASGDPTIHGVVLWTRLAPDPLAGGGLAAGRFAVDWEIAADDAFRSIVRRGSILAVPELAHSVHVEADGLSPARPYWYRFHAGSETSPTGRTWTLPVASSTDLRFAFCSCQHWEQGYYTAYRHMADEDIQLVLHLGDYIYENGPGNDAVRPHPAPEIFTLEEYRNRYALYRTDPDLRAAHAAFPFVVTWDDHEVDNNYAGAVPEYASSPETFLSRRAAAYQAFWEHQPLRNAIRPRGPDMQLYRRVHAGPVDFHVLDTRQYRTDQPCGDGFRAGCLDAGSAAATILGAGQRDWLLRGLAADRARWNVLASQVPIAPAGRVRDGRLEQSMDKWAGYLHDRDALHSHLHELRVRNPISIVGDVHVNWLADLKLRYDDANSPVVGTEFVGTSISSGGDGFDTPATRPTMLETNPHVRFFNGQRGYVRCDVTNARWTTDYRVIEYVTRPGAPIRTRASFVVEDGKAGAQPA